MLHDLLAARVRTDPGAPLITWYGGDGRREELSAVTFATAVAKTAALLTDEWDLADDLTVRLKLPLHWQAAVWLAACDVAGLTVVWDDAADLVVTADPSAVADRSDTAVALVSTAAFGLPAGSPGPGVLDHARDAMGQPDDLLSVPIGGSWVVGADEWDEQTIRQQATELLGRAGERPLIRGPLTPTTGLGCWPLPLLARSVVLVDDDTLSGQRIAEDEHTTGVITGEP